MSEINLNIADLPPLPELSIHELTAKELKQDEADNILKIIYNERPDFFLMLGKWNKKGELLSKQEKEQKDKEIY